MCHANLAVISRVEFFALASVPVFPSFGTATAPVPVGTGMLV